MTLLVILVTKTWMTLAYVITLAGCALLWVSEIQATIILFIMQAEYQEMSTSCFDLIPCCTHNYWGFSCSSCGWPPCCSYFLLYHLWIQQCMSFPSQSPKNDSLYQAHWCCLPSVMWICPTWHATQHPKNWHGSQPCQHFYQRSCCWEIYSYLQTCL